ncbi:MAG: lipoyl(octanoyl) transferase LipB [Phycisphaerales bacterium]|nr:lipoyl(octanoyl) transferase LipB [Phycisphaerales bacterium]
MEITHQLGFIDLGRMGYHAAYEQQTAHHAAVLASRESDAPELGRVLFVEHDPVITVTRRPDAAGHVTASPEILEQHGVEVHATDRGGDVTYHGPGQIVCYPIIDLNRARLRLHEYMRLLEDCVMDTMKSFGIATQRETGATGVWTDPGCAEPAKICAMGLRVRRWVTLHGLAINVRTNLEHFGLIVPCGLSRPVTSMEQELGDACPADGAVKQTLFEHLQRRISLSAQRGPAEHTGPRES